MASSSNPYEHMYGSVVVGPDYIDPDDGMTCDCNFCVVEADRQSQAVLEDADIPSDVNDSQRAPLTGNIRSQSSAPSDQSYLTSSIPGEDRRAPTNTIDESVWETLSRDLFAVWEKMRQVLWPKFLLGGILQRGGGIGGAAEEGRGGLWGMGRWPDADVVLQGGMSEGLRDWDMWYVADRQTEEAQFKLMMCAFRGPLVFCLLLSLLLSLPARADQKSLVFSGVFAMVWIGEAVVTLQIKLLGGNISFFQSVCIIGYTLFPLVIAAMLSALHLPAIARIPVYIVLVAWSLAAGVSILGGSGVVRNRVGIAVYPLFVFYVGLGCLCFIS
ncbi:MAG: hypothetical protein M1816_000116 [Peltula sp. TS41687]|nr:MAG: hypothetical protein M1816_000116 [Peltula sp. TS41687]